MMYLKREQEMFEEVKELFRLKCAEIVKRARGRDAERGRAADLGSPIHHRMSPGGMAHEIAKKGDRIQRKQEAPDWERDSALLKAIADDCVDVLNYAQFLGALCLMLDEELAAASLLAGAQIERVVEAADELLMKDEPPHKRPFRSRTSGREAK